MFHLALKMLLGDRAKYAMLVGGLTFAALLMTQQNGVFQGLLSWTTSNLRNMRASIWVVERTVEQVNETKALRDTDVNRVRSVTGVDFAMPLFQGVLIPWLLMPIALPGAHPRRLPICPQPGRYTQRPEAASIIQSPQRRRAEHPSPHPEIVRRPSS
ncbi:MAG: hypothetical protein ACKO3N_18310, partial [Verrucomicrobiota bacterium]